MLIGGLEKLTLIDYPNEIAAIVFTQGCNFRCGFCYNPMLVLPSKDGNKKGHSLLPEDDLFNFLKNRKGKLDGVVITGGEPTLHKDLPEFTRKIRDLGFKVKLDTNGTNPKMLAALLEEGLIDYIAMDIKAPLEKYKATTKFKGDLADIEKSVKIIMNGNLPYEFRTTVVPALLDKNDIEKMGEMIKGARLWYLQRFKPDTDLINGDLRKIMPYSDKELNEMREIGAKYVKKCIVR